MRLLLGAGAQRRTGWLTVDANPAFDPDLCCTAENLTAVTDASVEEIAAVDVLEHITFRNTDAALAEWARVLVPGGKLFVQVPDGETIMRWFVQDPQRLTIWEGGQSCTPLHGAQWRLLGGHGDGRYAGADDWQWNAHYSIWSEQSLFEALTRAGFEGILIERNGHPNLQSTCYRR